jgi:hypothetical protein
MKLSLQASESEPTAPLSLVQVSLVQDLELNRLTISSS